MGFCALKLHERSFDPGAYYDDWRWHNHRSPGGAGMRHRNGVRKVWLMTTQDIHVARIFRVVRAANQWRGGLMIHRLGMRTFDRVAPCLSNWSDVSCVQNNAENDRNSAKFCETKFSTHLKFS